MEKNIGAVIGCFLVVISGAFAPAGCEYDDSAFQEAASSSLALESGDVEMAETEGILTTYYASAGVFDFNVSGTSSAWYRGTSYMYRSSSSQATTMYAHFHLPQDADISSASCRVYDNSAGYSIIMYLSRKTDTSTESCGSASSTTTGTQTIMVANSCEDLVYNPVGSSYSTYMIGIQTSLDSSTDIRLYECHVTYSL